MSKISSTVDSPVGGNFKTIASILSRTILAPCFPFSLGEVFLEYLPICH
jgi:hypothetical protein